MAIARLLLITVLSVTHIAHEGLAPIENADVEKVVDDAESLISQHCYSDLGSVSSSLPVCNPAEEFNMADYRFRLVQPSARPFFRHDIEFHQRDTSQDYDSYAPTNACLVEEPGDVVDSCDWFAVDLHNHVTDPDASPIGGAVRDNFHDTHTAWLC